MGFRWGRDLQRKEGRVGESGSDHSAGAAGEMKKVERRGGESSTKRKLKFSGRTHSSLSSLLSQVLSFSFMMEWHISGTAQSDSIRIQSYILTPLSILVCTAVYKLVVNQYFKTIPNMKLWFCLAKRGESGRAALMMKEASLNCRRRRRRRGRRRQRQKRLKS